MRNLLYAWVLLTGLFSPAFGQVFSAGDTVRLVERDSHIPAHPAAGDNRVPFRFASGPTAQILAIDQPTGWLQIQGETVGGEPDQGWITPRYAVSAAGDLFVVLNIPSTAPPVAKGPCSPAADRSPSAANPASRCVRSA